MLKVVLRIVIAQSLPQKYEDETVEDQNYEAQCSQYHISKLGKDLEGDWIYDNNEGMHKTIQNYQSQYSLNCIK